MKSEFFSIHNLAFFLLFVLANSLAEASPSRTTYQAKIIKPDGYPLEASSVNFKFVILDPAGVCSLYSETYSSINMTGTGGLISFSLGTGVKVYPVSSTTFSDVFSNITPSLSCDTGGPVSYSPVASDNRKIVMQFNDGNGWQTLPAMNINAVPYAMYASEATKLNGLTSSDFVQVSTVPTCSSSEALRYTGTGFVCLAVGGSVTSSSVVSALGYTPANDAVSGTYMVKANNLSDIASVSSARSNLGLGSLAVLNAIDLSGSQASGTLAASRLPPYSGDVESTAGSAVLSLANIGSGVTSGAQYTKVTVDGKGRVTSGAQLISSDVTTALGYTPANSATIVSSQWSTSGSTINYSSGNVGIGTANPTWLLEVKGSASVGDSTANSGVLALNAANYAWYGWYLGGTRTAFIQSTASSYDIYSQTAGVPMIFYTSSSEKMRITSGGSIGIGIANPKARLETISGQVGGAQSVLFNVQLNNSGDGVVINGETRTVTEGTSAALKIVDTTGVNALRVNFNGNVGIGTSAPTTKLTVAGDIQQTACGVGKVLVYNNFCYDNADRTAAPIGSAQITCLQAGGHLCDEGELNAVCTSLGAAAVTSGTWINNSSTADDLFKVANNLACTNLDGPAIDGRANSRAFRCCYGVH